MDEKPEDIQSFLKEQSFDGEALEGGEFTLHSAKARAKLAQFAFPEPGLWVVKIVQAAVASGAPRIDFKFLKREVQIRFENTQDWDAEAILKLILSANTSPDPALMHLQTGLMAVSGGINETISWSCGGRRVELQEHECHLTDIEMHPELVSINATRPMKSLKEQGLFNSPVRYLFQQTAHEYKALVTRCRCSPIPVILDNYELPRHYACPSLKLPKVKGYNSESHTGRRQILALKTITNPASPGELAYPLVETEVPSEVEDLNDKLTFSGTQFPPTGPVDGVLVLHSAQQHKSQANFLVDGALIESCPLEQVLKDSRLERALEDAKEDFYLDIYLNTDVSQLDLSHFQIKNQDLEPLLPILALAAHETLKTIHECCERPWDFRAFQDFRISKRNVKNVTPGDILGYGFLSLFIPHAIVIGGITLVASPITALAKPHYDRRKTRALKEQICSALSKLEALA